MAELDAVEAVLDAVLQEAQCFQLGDLAVDGKDLLALGVPQGKRVGAVLKVLLDRVLDDSLPNHRETLLQAARELISAEG